MPGEIEQLYQGALAGLAVGGGPELAAAALALSAGLVEVNGFDPADLRKRLPAPDDPADASALARVAPIAMNLLHDAARGKFLAAEMSRLTHPGLESADACRYLAGLLIGALRGESKQRLLADLYSPVYNYWLFQQTALAPRIDRIARGEYQNSDAADVPASASPADTLESALWAFASSQDFAAGLQAASSIGGATQLRGAVYGQLAGAYYGYESIPAQQRAGIADPKGIERAAGALLRHTASGIRHFTSWEKRQPGTSAES